MFIISTSYFGIKMNKLIFTYNNIIYNEQISMNTKSINLIYQIRTPIQPHWPYSKLANQVSDKFPKCFCQGRTSLNSVRAFTFPNISYCCNWMWRCPQVPLFLSPLLLYPFHPLSILRISPSLPSKIGCCWSPIQLSWIVLQFKGDDCQTDSQVCVS